MLVYVPASSERPGEFAMPPDRLLVFANLKMVQNSATCLVNRLRAEK